jgi:hypothetical protein
MPRHTPSPALRRPARSRAGRLGAVLLLAPTLAATTPVSSQPPSDAGQPPAPRTARLDARRARPCDGRFAMVMLTVRDAQGAPVVGARLAARRADSRAAFPVQPQEHADGEYQLLDDTALPHLAGGDQAVDVVIAHGGRSQVVRQVLGRTADGCHVARRAGPETVTLR